MRLSQRPVAHLFFGNRAFRQTAHSGVLAFTIDFPSRYCERHTDGLFVPQEAIGFERVSQQAGQAPAKAIQLETGGNAAFEDDID
jgi:hypothetical protein